MRFFKRSTLRERRLVKRDTGKVSILVCSPDFDRPLAKKCLESIKAHTTGFEYELLLLENGKYGSFSHPEEINRAMDFARGEHFVTLDDDIEVTPGWLEALLVHSAPDVGAVGCVNLNLQEGHKGSVRQVGGFVRKDGSVVSYNKNIDAPMLSPFVCSCCMLIVNREIKFPTIYNKYYHEAHYCLENWLAGKKIVVSPHKIYHFGGGTMESLGYSRSDIHAISDRDRKVYVDYWNDNVAVDRLISKLKTQVPFDLK